MLYKKDNISAIDPHDASLC